MSRRAPSVRNHRCLRPLLVLAVAFALASPLAPIRDADAQSAVRPGASGMKRGAGTVNRGGGGRRGGDLGSRKASGTASNRSAATTSRPTFRSPGSNSSTTSAVDETSQTTDTTSATASASASDSSDAEAGSTDGEETEEVVDYGARTLGKSCMYGTRGEVIFRPRGAVCRGDVRPAAPAAAAPRTRPANPRRATGAQRPAARSGAPKAVEVRPGARLAPSKPSGSRGSCIYGGDGRVVYAPAGADCRR